MNPSISERERVFCFCSRRLLGVKNRAGVYILVHVHPCARAQAYSVFEVMSVRWGDHGAVSYIDLKAAQDNDHFTVAKYQPLSPWS